MATPSRGPTSARSASSPVQVLSVPIGLPIVVRFLGPVLGLDTHWKSGRTIPCPGDGECPSTLHKSGIIWKGYAAAQAWEATERLWRPWALEVTEALEETLRGRNLRGEVWSLSRKAKTAPVIGVYCERLGEKAAAALSPCFDITPILLRLFHVAELRLGQCNPLPPKVIMEAVAGDAPNLPAELLAASVPDNDPEKLREAAETWKRFREEDLKQRGRASANGASNNGDGKSNDSNNGH